MATFTPAGGGGVPVSAVVSAVGTVESYFDTALSVATNATVTVLSYTVSTTNSYMLKVDVSGTNIATYDITVNGSQFARKRTYWSGQFSETFNVGSGLQDAYKLSIGDIVHINVTNFRPTAGDFEARLQVIEVT